MKVLLINQKLSQHLTFWLGIITGIVFLYLVTRNMEYGKTFALIKGTLLGPIVVSVGLRTIGLWVRGLRWNIILERIKEVSSVTVFRIVCIAELGNYLLPARIGDVMQGLMIAKKENVSKGFSFTSIAIVRLLDVLVVSSLFVLFSFVLPFPQWAREVGYMIGSIIIIIVIGCFILLWGEDTIIRFSRNIFSLVPSVKGRVSQSLRTFFDELSVVQKWSVMIRAAVLSVILWGIYSAAFYFVLMGLRIDLPWYVSIVTVATIGMGQMLPSTPGFVGTYEFFCVWILTLFSLDRSMALGVALLSHGLQYIVVIGIGSVCYFWECYFWGRISLDYQNVAGIQGMLWKDYPKG